MVDQPIPRPHGHGVNVYDAEVDNFRCPYCSHNGAFHGYQAHDIGWLQWGNEVVQPRGTVTPATPYRAGLRSCPNPSCRGLVFVLKEGKKVTTYPAELKEFNGEGVPTKVRSCMEEAIKCEAQKCYRAAALMIRRTLEALCEDRSAVGKTLADRIDALGKTIIIPTELLQGAHELRLMGNDAAHIEARIYSDIGAPEVEAALELTKALLWATYQTQGLVSKLRSLRP